MSAYILCSLNCESFVVPGIASGNRATNTQWKKRGNTNLRREEEDKNNDNYCKLLSFCTKWSSLGQKEIYNIIVLKNASAQGLRSAATSLICCNVEHDTGEQLSPKLRWQLSTNGPFLPECDKLVDATNEEGGISSPRGQSLDPQEFGYKHRLVNASTQWDTHTSC